MMKDSKVHQFNDESKNYKNIIIAEIKSKLEDSLLDYYKNLMEIESVDNSLKILLPVFLDDATQFNLYLTYEKDKVILSSNLFYALDESLTLKTQCGKNILKDFIMDKKEYSELKSELQNKGFNTDTLSLEYIKALDNNLSIFEEIIKYTELSKSFYNNLYHLLINRLSKPHEKHNIFYTNFNNIVSTVNKKISLTRYEDKTVSKNPIYTGKNLILSASKDFDSLGLLYMDLLDIKEKSKTTSKALVFIESEKTKDKYKLGVMMNRFRGSGFELKEISKNSMSDDEILAEIEKRIPNEKSI